MLKTKYKIIWSLLAYTAFPFFCLYALCNPKLRKSFSERLGLGTWEKLEPADDYIWIHGASVGEISGLDSLFRKFSESDNFKRYKTFSNYL